MNAKEQILEVLEDGAMRSREIAECTGLIRWHVKKGLRELAEEGLIERVFPAGGSSGVIHYQLARPGRHYVRVWLQMQRETLIGRFITGAPL